MKPRVKNLAITAGVSAFTLICSLGCGGSGSKYSYQGVSVTLSPAVQSIMVNGTQTFSATTNNAPNYPDWFLENVIGSVPNDGPGSPNAGTMTTASTDSPNMTYTAPPSPPIYNATQIAAGAVQGSVTVLVFVHSSASNFLSTVSATETFVITAPSVTVGLSPATASVELGGTQQFTAYAVGSVNNTLTWEVNGFAGGTSANGTITALGLYTAPTTIPMSGNTVTIAAVSQADSTKSATSVVTLTSQ